MLKLKELRIPEDVLELQKLVRFLIEKMSVLEARVIELETENKALKAENAELRAENAELKARLGLDSHNSSKPPSTDGLRKKPAFPRGKNGKKGGQVNHAGKTLDAVKDPDKIVECKVEKCTCGHDLTGQTTKILSRRQEFDLPEPRLIVTEFQALQTICPHCNKIHKGEFPQGINAPVQYGNRVKAFITMLINNCMLSFKRAQTLFNDMYGYNINEGTILKANQTCYNNLEQSEKAIQEKIIASPTVNCDETGIRCAGKLHWLHVASTAFYTYLFAHSKRGKEAIESEQSILQKFFNWTVHDCWASYFNLGNVKHAVCGAHILRELQAQIENMSDWALKFKTFLLKIYKMPIDERIKIKSEIQTEFDLIIKQGQIEEPCPEKTGKRGKLKRTKGRNLLERLEKLKAAVLAFAFNDEVPFTNNQAERDLRPVKVKLKVSGCFRTFVGAEHYARIAGFVSTSRKNKLNVFRELYNVFIGKSFLLQQTT